MKNDRPKDRIGVLGDGGWGTALAMVLCEGGAEVVLWSPFPDYAEELKKTRRNPKFLPGVEIPSDIVITSDLGELQSRDLFFSVIPSKYLRSVMERFKEAYPEGRPLVSATKGIEENTLQTATEVIIDVLGPAPTAVVSGPSHAEEVALGMPTTVVAASEDVKLALWIQVLLHTDRFRVYTHSDVIGVELGGALKNVISIAAGIVDGLGFGANTKSALLSRGLVEMARLGQAMQAQRGTFFGLSGIGDLMTSCFSPYGRNRSVGDQLGRGLKIREIVDRMEQVAEGVITTSSVFELMGRHGVEMPICREVYRVIYEDKAPEAAVHDLMTRRLKDEMQW
jgi:glycerol-3-phosphate dehydrogenase (NAD(P)+)